MSLFISTVLTGHDPWRPDSLHLRSVSFYLVVSSQLLYVQRLPVGRFVSLTQPLSGPSPSLSVSPDTDTRLTPYNSWTRLVLSHALFHFSLRSLNSFHLDLTIGTKVYLLLPFSLPYISLLKRYGDDLTDLRSVTLCFTYPTPSGTSITSNTRS